MNNNYYDLFFTVIKNRGERIVKEENEYEGVWITIQYLNYKDFILPSFYIGIKPCETLLR